MIVIHKHTIRVKSQDRYDTVNEIHIMPVSSSVITFYTDSWVNNGRWYALRGEAKRNDLGQWYIVHFQLYKNIPFDRLPHTSAIHKRALNAVSDGFSLWLDSNEDSTLREVDQINYQNRRASLLEQIAKLESDLSILKLDLMRLDDLDTSDIDSIEES